MERRVERPFKKIELTAAALTEAPADQVAVRRSFPEAGEEHEVEMTFQ